MGLEIVQLNSVNYVPGELLERLEALALKHEVADVLVPSASHVRHAQKAIATGCTGTGTGGGIGNDTGPRARGNVGTGIDAGIGAGVMVYTPNSYVAKYWPLITNGNQIATKAQIEVFAAQVLEEARARNAAAVKEGISDDFIYHVNKIGVIADILMSTTLERLNEIIDSIPVNKALNGDDTADASTMAAVETPGKSKSKNQTEADKTTAASENAIETGRILTENERIILTVARDTLARLHDAQLITQEEAAVLLARDQTLPLPPLFVTGFEQADKNLIRFVKTLSEKIPVTYFAPGTEAGCMLANALSKSKGRIDIGVYQDYSALANFDSLLDSTGVHANNGATQTPEQRLLPRLVFLEPLGPSAEAESIASYLKTYTDTKGTECFPARDNAAATQIATSPSPKTKGSDLAETSMGQAQSALVVTVDPERAWQTLAPKLTDTMTVHASWSKPLLICKPVALFLRFVEQLWDIMDSQKEWNAFAARWTNLGVQEPVNSEVLQTISTEYSALPSTWWPPTDIVDFLHSSLSPFAAEDVDAFDASMRSRRDLTPNAVLRELKSIEHCFSRGEKASLRDEGTRNVGNVSLADGEREEHQKAFCSMLERLLTFDLKGALEATLPIASKDDSKEALQGMSQLYSFMLALQSDYAAGAEEVKVIKESAEDDRAKEAKVIEGRAQENPKKKTSAAEERAAEEHAAEERAEKAHEQLALLKAMARNASINYSYQAGPSIKAEEGSAGSSDSATTEVTVDIVTYNSATSILPNSYDICVLADQSMEAQTARMYLTSVERLINDKLGNAEQVPRETVSAAKNEQLYAIAREYIAFEKPQKTDEGREVYSAPLLGSVEAALKKISNDNKNEDAKNASQEKEASRTAKNALESYKKELVEILGPWVQQSEEHVRQNYLARENNQTPQEYPFEENIELTGNVKELLGRAKIRDKSTGEISLTEKVRLSPTSLETLRNCPRKWFFERGLATHTIDAEMDALAKGTLYHDVLNHVLEGAISAQGDNQETAEQSRNYATLFDEAWSKRFAQAIALAGGADITLSDKDAEELTLMNNRTEQPRETDAHPPVSHCTASDEVRNQSEYASHKDQDARNLLQNFLAFVPKSLQETQIIRDMDQNLHRLLESGEVLVEGFHPAFFEYPFDSTTAQDKDLSYAGTGQKGLIDRIDIDENGNILIIDYKSSSKASLSQYQIALEEDGSTKTEIYPHPQTFIYAQVINKLKPRLKEELEASALPHVLKQKLKQKDLKVIGVLYLGVADWQAYYGCVQQGMLPAQFTQGSWSNNVTQISQFDPLVDDFEANLSELVAERIEKGILPPQPLKDGKDVCKYCAYKYKCAFDMRKKEAEIEKYEQWSQMAAEKTLQDGAQGGRHV